MGELSEDLFDGLERCPYCKSKKLKAYIIDRGTVYFKDGKNYTEEELDNTDVEFYCQRCGRRLKIKE